MRFFASILVFILTTGSVAAQTTGSGSTGSGAVLTQEEIRAQDRTLRAMGFRSQMLKTKKSEADYREMLQLAATKAIAARRQCRSDIRRANRDTKFPVQLRCFRAEMQAHLDVLVEERAYIVTALGLTQATRDRMTAAIDRLTDAIAAILSAIDSGLYQTEEDLLEAKKNLHALYHIPVWNARVMVRADRVLSWIAHLFTRLESAEMEEKTKTGTVRENWNAVRTCLEEGENQLHAVMIAKIPAASLLVAADDHVLSCLQTLRAIPPLPDNDE